MRDFQRRGHVGAGGGADQQAELAVQPARHGERLRAGHFDFAVQRRRAEQLRNETVGDTFDAVAARHLAAKQRRLGRIHRQDFRLRITLFDRAAHPGQSAARAVTGHHRVNRPGHLPQDFLPGRNLVVFGVQGILKLARQKVTAVLRGHFARQIDARLITPTALE